MKFIEKVRGSKELAVPLIIQKTTVYVKVNIHEVESEDDVELYEWDEYQYNKDEYIEIMQNEIIKRDQENKAEIEKIYKILNDKNQGE